MSEFDFNPKAPAIIVPVELRNGKVSVFSYLVLDTGATHTMISWDIAESLGFKPERASKAVRFNTASGDVTAPMIKIDEVSVEGASAKKVDSVVHTLPVSARIDGLLGLSFLRNFDVRINFKEGVLELD